MWVLEIYDSKLVDKYLLLVFKRIIIKTLISLIRLENLIKRNKKLKHLKMLQIGVCFNNKKKCIFKFVILCTYVNQ